MSRQLHHATPRSIYCMAAWVLFAFSLIVCLLSAKSFHPFAPMTSKVIRSLVICGPSGVGKGTLINKILSNYPNKMGLSVSHTTRKPRQGEVNGIHYHFSDKDFVLQDIKSGGIPYIEHAEVHANIYGTREDAVAKVHDDGKLCILDVDKNGVMQIKKHGLPAKFVFVAPKSIEVLENRLRSRGTESEDQIQLRLKNAQSEMDYGLAKGNFDLVLVNENLDEAYGSLVKQLRNWYPLYNL